MPALELAGIEASYGPLQVLFGVELSVAPGERLALLGTNGAGKSTVLRVAMGLLPPSAGTVRHRGTDVTALSTEQRTARGLTLVVGGRGICGGLSARENLTLGAWLTGGERSLVEARMSRALELFPALRPRLDTKAGTLSGGEQQMLAVSRALMAEPDVLLIDEMSLGLAPVVVGQVTEAVAAIAASGVTIVVVEQSLNVAAAVCERAVFMEKGEVRFSGAVTELAQRGDLARSVFLGAGRALRFSDSAL